MVVGYSPISEQRNRSGRVISPASWEALVLHSAGDIDTIFWALLDQEYYSTGTWEGFQERVA